MLNKGSGSSFEWDIKTTCTDSMARMKRFEMITRMAGWKICYSFAISRLMKISLGVLYLLLTFVLWNKKEACSVPTRYSFLLRSIVWKSGARTRVVMREVLSSSVFIVNPAEGRKKISIRWRYQKTCATYYFTKCEKRFTKISQWHNFSSPDR